MKRFLGFVKVFRDKDPKESCKDFSICPYKDGPYCDVDTCRLKDNGK